MANYRKSYRFSSGSPQGVSGEFMDLVSNNLTSHRVEKRMSNNQSPANSASGTIIHVEEDPYVSDCESGVSGSNSHRSQLLSDRLVELEEGDELHGIIKRRFVSGLGSLAAHTTVVGIHRNTYSSFTGEARVRSFQIFAQALEKKNGGDANMTYAWYAAAKHDIPNIISHGFGLCEKAHNSGLYGHGIYLAPEESSIESVKCSSIDEDGLRHVLLCRVLLGKAELVQLSAEQSHPSSEEFDSGVDSFVAPKKYVIWSTHMNTHILPEFVVSFRAPPSLEGFLRIQDSARKPSSPWMPFPMLISTLSKFLSPHHISSIIKYHCQHREKKITRHELVQQVRKIAGDKLLIAVIKSFRTKQPKAPTNLSQSMPQNGTDGAEHVCDNGIDKIHLAQMSSGAQF